MIEMNTLDMMKKRLEFLIEEKNKWYDLSNLEEIATLEREIKWMEEEEGAQK